MDLSRNKLEGIDSLLMVEIAPPEDSKAGGEEGNGTKQSTYAYPLVGLQELRLNGCVAI